MSDGMVRKWVRAFKDGRTNVQDEERSGRPSMLMKIWCPVLLVEFLPRNETIKAASYCETLNNPRRAIQNKRRGKLSKGIVLLHDSARPHVANRTKDLIKSFKWETLDHPPYSPDLAPSDYHLFLHLKKHLGGQRLQDDNEVKTSVIQWLTSQAAEFYEEGTQKLVPRYDKCLNIHGNYVEK